MILGTTLSNNNDYAEYILYGYIELTPKVVEDLMEKHALMRAVADGMGGLSGIHFWQHSALFLTSAPEDEEDATAVEMSSWETIKEIPDDDCEMSIGGDHMIVTDYGVRFDVWEKHSNTEYNSDTISWETIIGLHLQSHPEDTPVYLNHPLRSVREAAEKLLEEV